MPTSKVKIEGQCTDKAPDTLISAFSGMHRYLYFVYNIERRPPPCAVAIRKTCTDQQLNGFQESAYVQDQNRSMC